MSGVATGQMFEILHAMFFNKTILVVAINNIN